MWSVTVNAPGYLPDSEPVECAVWMEAATECARALELTHETVDDTADLEGALSELRSAPFAQPVTVYLAGLAHNIDRV